MNAFQQYLRSFSLGKDFWRSFFLDLIYFSIVITLFLRLGNYFQQKIYVLTGGRTTEEIQQLLSTSPDQLVPLLTQLKSLLIFFIGTILLSVLFTFLFYSFTQGRLWSYLLHKPFSLNHFWHWNLLHLVLIAPVLSYSVIAFMIKITWSFMVKSLITASPTLYFQQSLLLNWLQQALNNGMSFMLMVFFLLILFLTYYHFIQKDKAWAAIGEALHSLRVYWSSLWRLQLLATVTGLILTAMIIPIRKFLIASPSWSLALDIIIFLLFLAWLRVYLVGTIEQPEL